MGYIYGVLDNNNCHVDISRSLKGTKRVATIDGYEMVSQRNENHMYVDILFVKVAGKWVDYDTYIDNQNN